MKPARKPSRITNVRPCDNRGREELHWLPIGWPPTKSRWHCSLKHRNGRGAEPMLCGDSDEGKVFDASLGSFALSRDVGRALAAHAMLRLKLGKTDACWEDLLACHRFGRLTGQEPNTIQGLVAISIDTMACEGDQAMLQHAPLTSAQAVKMRDDLAALPPLPNMVEKIDTSERFLFLDLVAGMARDGFDSMSGSLSKSPVPKDAYVRATLDWDQILRMGNSWYDRMVVAGRKPRVPTEKPSLSKSIWI